MSRITTTPLIILNKNIIVIFLWLIWESKPYSKEYKIVGFDSLFIFSISYDYDVFSSSNERLIRKFIEVNDFWENYIALYSAYKYIRYETLEFDKNETINLFYCIIRRNRIAESIQLFFEEDIDINYIFVKHALTKESYENYEGDVENNLVIGNVDRKAKNILMAENILTGSTVQTVINYLHSLNYNTSEIIYFIFYFFIHIEKKSNPVNMNTIHHILILTGRRN